MGSAPFSVSRFCLSGRNSICHGRSHRNRPCAVHFLPTRTVRCRQVRRMQYSFRRFFLHFVRQRIFPFLLQRIGNAMIKTLNAKRVLEEASMKATGIVRRIDDLGRVVIPKEIRRTLRIREGDPLQTALTRWERFCFAMDDLAKRNGWE